VSNILYIFLWVHPFLHWQALTSENAFQSNARDLFVMKMVYLCVEFDEGDGKLLKVFQSVVFGIPNESSWHYDFFREQNIAVEHCLIQKMSEVLLIPDFMSFAF